MQVSAIETRYAGHIFRSRLEARWAVFFDELGIEWKYESEGYESKEGARYLPDFFLPQEEVWCEVKGDRYALQRDAARMSKVLQPGGPLPLLLLGDVEDPHDTLTLHPILSFTEKHGLVRCWSMFVESQSGVKLCSQGDIDAQASSEHARFMTALGLGYEISIEKDEKDRGWLVASMPFRRGDGANFQRVNNAYMAARTARFEHGESGARIAK